MTGPRQRLVVAAVFLAAAVALWFVSQHRGTDLYLHALFLEDCIEQRFMPAAFLYFLVLAVITLFSTDVPTILVGSSLLLGAAVAARFATSTGALRRWLSTEPSLPDTVRRLVVPSALGLSLIVCLPLPGELWTAGQFPPNLWHNSTQIFLMPFAVLLFVRSLRFLDGDNGIPGLTVLVVLNVLIKPSLFFCFAPVFPLFALARFGWSTRFLRACIPSAVGTAVLLVQYLVIYHDPTYDRVTEASGASVALGWFRVWGHYTDNIALAVVNSVLWPLLFAAVYPREFWRDRRIRFAAALLGAAIAIYALVYETGARELHGNFGWQPTICNFLLHLAVLGAMGGILARRGRLVARDWLLIVVFELEVAVGLVYLAKVIATGDYV